MLCHFVNLELESQTDRQRNHTIFAVSSSFSWNFLDDIGQTEAYRKSINNPIVERTCWRDNRTHIRILWTDLHCLQRPHLRRSIYNRHFRWLWTRTPDRHKNWRYQWRCNRNLQFHKYRNFKIIYFESRFASLLPSVSTNFSAFFG